MDIVLSVPEIYGLGLVFTRVTAVLLTAPLFRGRNVPGMVKMGLALLLSLLLAPLLPIEPVIPLTIWGLGGFLLREAAVGISMGFFVQIFFFAVGVAGQLIDTEMGFHMANVLDPMSDSQLPLIGNLFSMLCILLYLGLHGHLLLIKALAASFKLLPAGILSWPLDLGFIVKAIVRLLPLAVQIALPVIGASLFTSFMFGIMAKTVPQMNVFIVGMPLKIVLLSLMLVVALPGLVFFMENSLGELFLQLGDWLAGGQIP